MKKVRSVDEGGLRSAALGGVTSPVAGAAAVTFSGGGSPGPAAGVHTGSLRLSDVRAGMYCGRTQPQSASLSSPRSTAAAAGAAAYGNVARTRNEPMFYGSTGRMMTASSASVAGSGGAAAAAPNRYQVEFSAEQRGSSSSSLTSEDRGRRRSIRLLLNSETCFAGLVQFGVERYVHPSHVSSAKVLSPQDHKTLFQNSEQFPPLSQELCLMIREDLLKSGGRKVGFILHKEIDRICRTYKTYCLGLKQADAVLAKKLRDRKFIKFLEDPPIPKRKPDITTFIHKPFEHLRRLLLALLCIQRFTTNQHEDWVLLQASIHKLRECYKEINVKTGLMEPPSSIKHKTLPFLSIEDLESRLVFINTLQPFKLSVPGRKWIFGGQLWKLSGRQGAKDYWAMLFSDVLVLTQVNRDRVIFVMEEPILLSQVADVIFSKKKKSLTFRLVLDPKPPAADKNGLFSGGGSQGASCLHWRKVKKVVILKAPSAELKSMWQNLLERQMFYVRNPHMSTSYSVQSLASSLRSFSLENLSSGLPSPADTLAHCESVGTSSSTHSSPTPVERIPLWSRIAASHQKKKAPDTLAGKVSVSPGVRTNGVGTHASRTNLKQDDDKAKKEANKRDSLKSPPPYSETPDSAAGTLKNEKAASVDSSTTGGSPAGTLTDHNSKTPQKVAPSTTASVAVPSVSTPSKSKPSKGRKFLLFSSKSKEQKHQASKEVSAAKDEEDNADRNGAGDGHQLNIPEDENKKTSVSNESKSPMSPDANTTELCGKVPDSPPHGVTSPANATSQAEEVAA